ncbi:uncharacterized protein Z520_00773 [Fonsecaea multimorphosa CBS 102226]|uniref:EthD domain-containing protein n=1 Tax=Fonsecaea multimorphosa CBS 102226 TaxID=1442371 RepID=A0A0D2HQC3_9EURO|nr:uncharacterized protein Z520_00773 [Fonsecaea multimorphosa CBS 102226]KIY04081.1 hypothetical protein Z520_00773 [Fonsecaea multimorphosa CBS 102226]OAL31915.1 hypothetical protein AYO22_00785 [Fonsecaea multimorphosa]
MVYNSTVLYPNDEGATFDVDYYINTHMPIVQKAWGKHGLIDVQLIHYDASFDASKRYNFGAVLTWESKDSIKTAVASPESKEVFEDVPKFRNRKAHFLVGELVQVPK